jgi:hypothetical protein
MRSISEPRGRAALAWLAALGTLLAAAPAAAWECVGVPSSVVFAGVAYDDAENLTGTVGLGPVIDGHSGLSVNYVRFADQPNGSKLSSVGVRFIYTTTPGEERHFNWCMLLGFQVARGWLVNADGLRMNARIDTRILPAGLGFSYRLGTPHLGLIGFAVPQLRLVSRDLTLYGRSSEQDLPESPRYYGVSFGATAALGPVFAKGAVDWTKDQPTGWTVTLGVGW